MKTTPAPSDQVASSPGGTAALDAIIATQFLIACAGEALSTRRRSGRWQTDLIHEDGGGDLLGRGLAEAA